MRMPADHRAHAAPDRRFAPLRPLQRPLALLVWGICTPGAVGSTASITRSLAGRWFNPNFTAARSDVVLLLLHREIEASWSLLVTDAPPLLGGLVLGWLIWNGHAWRWLAWTSNGTPQGGHP